MSKNLKATNAKTPSYPSAVGAAATKPTAAMPSKGTKFLIKPDLGKNKKDLLKTMVYHDSTAMVFAKEVQSQMLTSMNPKSPSGRHDGSPQGPNQVVLSLEGPHHELDSATNKVYVQMQNQQQLLTNLKAAHQKSPPQYIAHAPAFVQQQQQPHHVDIMPATSTAVTPPPPPLTQLPTQPPTAQHHPSPAPSPSSTSATTTTTTKRGGKSAANKVQFKCELCGMTFGSKSAHTSHTKSHANKGEITSSGKLAAAGEGAAKELDVSKQLTQIKAISTAANGGGDPYQCNVCQKTFAVPARLIRHYRTHTGERPFECEFCHKLFSVKENLQVHRRIHTKERPYKCDVCGRAFEHSGKLHRHMRIHTGERPHKCSVCEKTFIQSGQLVIHMRTHTGEKPYKCPVEGCGKGFTCSKQLKVHSRTHTGEKPYHCDICFRDFGYNHVLKLHRVQHYGSKCYKCTICDETFKGKKEMEAHIKGHANDDGAEGGDASNGAAVASSSSRSSPAPNAASPDSGNHIKSESISADMDVLDNAVSSLLDHGKQDSMLPTSTQQFIGSSAQSPMSSAASPSSLSASYLSSVGSPTMSGNSSNTTLGLDALDTNSYHGEAPKVLQSAAVFGSAVRGKPQATAAYATEEMPTDLSVPQQQEVKQLPTTTTANAQSNPPTYYEADAEAAHYRMQENSLTNLQSVRNYHHVASNGMSYNGNGLSSQQQQQQAQQQQQPTINPALLEAASIASRSVLLESREHEATEAALQILQLNRSRTPGDVGHYSVIPSGLSAESSHYEDMYETNELISHYKRGDLAKHGLHKGYVPVPKFESSLHLDENIVRKVEAAIAPLRTSTESPERSSSPESDCMMMADRDIMTLPLRKRKIYMSEKDKMQATRHEEHGANGNGEVADMAGICEMNTKAVRMSSVIQFAKAS